MQNVFRCLIAGIILSLWSAAVAHAGGFGAFAAMNTTRYYHTATLLPSGKVLAVGGFYSAAQASAELYDPASNSWSFVSNMATARYDHTATLLPNGKVLVVGGGDGISSLNSAELYDPVSNSWSSAGSMVTIRRNHTATLLDNGKVLVVGGRISGSIATAELYDPGTNSWSTAGTMATARYSHTATLLPGGKVLIAGGPSVASAELYDPTANSWSSGGTMAHYRHFHSATLLPNGSVLVAGGLTSSLGSVELYNPSTNSWATAASLAGERFNHIATLLPNGKVLLAGGNNPSAADIYDYTANSWSSAGSMMAARYYFTATLLANGRVLLASGASANSELYDYANGSWSGTSAMPSARLSHAAVQLPDGNILVAGGYNGSSYTANASLYNAAAGTWSDAGAMSVARDVLRATLLLNGKVMVTGGSNGSSYLSTTELYDSAANSWSVVAAMSGARTFHRAVLLPSGKVLVTGGYNGSSFLASAELYDSLTNSWTSAGSMAIARANHSLTLLPNGKVLVAGGTNGSYHNSAELYDPATNTWSIVASMVTGRDNHSATLLPGGKVLIAGGYNGSSAIASAELYDPGSGSWSSVVSMAGARLAHRASLLPDGKVLVTGGASGSALSSAELYDPGLGFSDTRRPVVTAAAVTSAALHIGGSGFNGDSESSGGGSNSSASNFPLLHLQRSDNEQSSYVLPDPVSSWSATTFTSKSLYGLPIGHYRASVVTNAIPSKTVVIRVAPTGSVSTFALDFPSTSTHTTSEPLSVTLTNDGAADLSIHSNAIGGPDAASFALSGSDCGSSLAPGSSCTVNVTFIPATAGSKSATLAVYTNDPDVSLKAITLSGAAVWSTYPLTISFLDSGSGSVGLSTGGSCTTVSGGCSQSFNDGTAVTLTPSPLAGSFFAGWGGDCSGTGPCSLTMTAAKSAEATFTSYTPLPMGSISYDLLGGFGSTGTALLSGSSHDLKGGDLHSFGPAESAMVQYDITTDITGSGTVNCTAPVEHGFTTTCTVAPISNALLDTIGGCGGSLAGSVYTTGPITADCTISATFIGFPGININPSPVDFGDRAVGTGGTTQALTLSNPGGALLTVSGITLSGDGAAAYSVAPGSCGSLTPSVAAGSSCALQVTFTPTAQQLWPATLAITSNDPAAPTSTVTLSGKGVAVLFDLSLAFSGAGSGSVAFSSGGSCTAACNMNIAGGSQVTLTPTADSGAVFSGWSGCDSVAGNVCTVAMSGIKGVIAGFAVAAQDDSQWEQTYGLTGAVMSLAVNPVTPATVYAGTDASGVFASPDGGLNWTEVNNGLSLSSVLSLVVNPLTPTTVYAGTLDGVYRTTDGGAVWSAVNSGLTELSVWSLLIDPLTPTTVYAGSGGGGVFKSIDGGDNWSPVNSGLTSVDVWSLAIDPVTPTTLYAGTFDGVFISTNGGTSWTAGGSGLTGSSVTALVIDPVTPATLYAGTESGGVFKSVNGGAGWTVMNNGLTNSYVLSLAIDPSAPERLYAATSGGGVFKSVDGAASWSAMNNGLPGSLVSVLTIDPVTPATLFAGTVEGVFKLGHAAPLIAVTPSSHTFSATATYSSSLTQAVAIANNGTASLSVTGIILAGADSGQFSIAAGSCPGLTPTIAAGSSCTVSVTFSPTTVGAKTATLQIASSDPATPTSTVSLSGSAYDPAPFGTISINGGSSHATATSVTLTLAAFDNSGSVAEMRFSNNNASWSGWSLYDTTASWSLMALGGDGSKTVYVQFRDAAGNASGSFSDSITLDTTPPAVTLTQKPAAVYNSASGTVTFTASETAAFTCSLDGAAATPCTSPYSFSSLADGSHTIMVTATDLAGLTGTASHSWNSDTAAPGVTFSAVPASPSALISGSISFTSEVGVTFQCRLDGGSWGACSSPFAYGPLSDGSHSFSVRAADAAGNVSAAAVHSWSIDTSAPAAVKNGAASYATLTAALTAAGDGSTLQLLATMVPEPITYSGSSTLTLSGGYDGSWSQQAGSLSPVGTVTIVSGTLIFDGIVIQ